MKNKLTLRGYRSADCAALAVLFYETVHCVNRKDYSQAQVDAWATGNVDLAQWDASFREHHTLIAEIGGTIVGFGDVTRDGYLDRLYVHKAYQRQGIAAALCTELERSVGNAEITTHASITARGFFEKRGYKVLKEQQVERRGVWLTNYVMRLER